MRIALLVILISGLAFAQAVGDKVLLNYHGDWVEGEIIGQYEKQFLIRHQTQFGPAQEYYDPSMFKPLGQAQPAPAAPAPAPVAPAPTARPAAPPAHGQGLMSEQEVLSKLRAQLGDNPWGPNRAQVMSELAAEIKARGLTFHFSADSQFYQEVSKFGATSELTRPLYDNYGPPPQRSALLGSWRTEVNAPATYFTKGNDLWRHNAKVEKLGGLTINPAGTYSWTLSTGKTVTGKWRPATPEEMQTAGGEGLVLLGGREGYDWIVTKYRDTLAPNIPTDWITVADLQTRQSREFGTR